MSCKYILNNQTFNSKEELKAHFSQRKNINKDVISTFGGNTSTTITPFKGTDQWTSLVMRRVLQMATQEGYDGVALATGQQSADMYSLSNQVSVLYYKKNEDGTYEIDADLKGGDNTNIGEFITEDKLADYVGKEVANKIIAGEGTNSPSRIDEGYKFLKGLDLEVGGEGMKTFYDKIVTKVAQKEAQRFDKNVKLEEVDFNEKTNVSITEEDGGFILKVDNKFVEYIDEDTLTNANLENTKEGAKKYFEKYIPQEINADKLALAKQPFIPITDKMKESLNQAIPLFQKEGIGLTTAGFTYKGEVFLNSEANSESVEIHEFSHLFLDFFKSSRPEVYAKGMQLVEKELKLGEKSEIKDIIEFVRRIQPNLTGERLTNEILTELLGRKGIELIEEIKGKVKKGGILEWLSEVWAQIKEMLGLENYSDQEIMNMNLGEFVRATNISLLKGEEIVGNKAQEYFTRNADRLPLTLSVFSRPEFVKLQGKEVNPITVLNSLNQTGIKQIEKDFL